MKGILFTVIIFLGLVVFLIFNLKNQTKKIQEVKQSIKQQNLADGKSQAENYQQQDAQNNLTKTFASAPIDTVDEKKYQNFFQDAVIKEGRIYRWNKANLTYYIDLLASRRLSKSKVRRAFDICSKKTKIFTFREVTNPAAADIFIKVADASEKTRMGEAGPDKAYAGQSFKLRGMNINEYVINHAQVTIAIDYFDHEKMAEYTKAGTDHGFQTLVHELGHVLGIMGHSPSPGDCMYFQADPKARACDVLTKEVNTLAMIYGKPQAFTRGFYEARRT
ncbi:MAG: matrixin family metalloprotease [Candidatus Caenarcaniphilales bacterium]|nr:matrixin family metalloprotease [Candidatus Caenarcaniphilales bacterium]